MKSSLGNSITNGTIWSACDKFGTVFLQFIINLVLARLLTPDDFGLVGMILIIVAVSNVLTDGGFCAALIQKINADDRDFSTTFYVNIIVALLLYATIYVLSPWIAVVLNNPIFEELLRILSLVIIINSFSIVPKALLRRTLSFKQIAIANITAYIIAAGVAITMAKMGYGLWSIIALHITNSAISTLLLALFAHWRPSATFSSISLKALFGYGGYILISDMLSNICFHIQSTLVGRYFSPYVAGQYAQAKKMEEVACITLPSAMNQVLFPVYSKLQLDIDKLQSTLRINTKTIAYIIFPLLTILMIIAEPLILFLLGDKWLGAVPYFQVLCIGGYFCSLQYFNYHAVAAIGCSKVLFYAGLFKSVVLIGSILIGVHINMNAVLIAMVLSNVVNYLTNAIIAQKHIGYRLIAQVCDILPIFSLAIGTGVVVFGISLLVNIHWILLAFIYVLLYLAISYVLHNEILNLLLKKLR